MRRLRPDFQNPTGRQPDMGRGNLLLPGTEAAEPAPATEAVAWPKTQTERVTAVRDLVQKEGGVWTAEAVARRFKNAKRADVAAGLDAMAALSTLQREDGPPARYRAA